MADTIARLIFEANTAQLKKANDELKKLAKESGKSTKAVTEQTTAEQKLAKAKTASDKVQAKIVAAKNKRETQAYAEQIKRDNASAVLAKKVSDQRAKAAEKASEQVKAASEKAAAAQQKASEKATQAQAKEAKKAAEAQKKAVVNAAKAQEKASAKAAARIRVLAKAEIAAYKEAERLEKAANKAASGVDKVGKSAGNAGKKTNKLAEEFKRASNTAAILTGPLGGVSGRLSFIATGLGRVTPLALAGTVGIAGLGAAAGLALSEFAEFESQVFKLEAMLQATGGTVGLTSQELQDLANEVGMATLASAGDIREAQGILLTFGSITGKQFKETTVLSQDLAAVMGVTAQSAAKTLGKALEDPINNLSSLSRAGVVFTDTEKEIIDALMRTNRGMEAQDFIISKLTKKVGGAGEGAGKGLAGAFDGLSEQVGLLKQAFAEESGLADFFEARVKSLTAFAKSLTEAISAAEDTPTPKGGNARKAVRARNQANALDRANAAPEMTNEEKIAAGTHKQSKRGFVEIDAPRQIGGVSTAEGSDIGATGGAKDTTEEAATPPPLPFADLPSTKEANAALMAMDLEILESKMANATILDDFHTQFREQKLAADQQAAVAEYEAAILKAEQDTLFGEERKALAMEELIAKNEVIMNNNLLLEQEEERHKAKLGDIDAKAAIAKAKFEKLTRGQQTKQMVGDLSARLGAAANMNKAMFRLSQMAAIADTVVNTRAAMQLARKTYPAPFGAVMAGVELVAGMANVAAIKKQSFGGGGGGGGGSVGGGGAGGASAASIAPVQPLDAIEEVAAPQPINVTVDGSIDPSGARRIIEAINEATEDGLEINALVGS